MKIKATESFEEISRAFFSFKYRIVAAWGGSRSGKTYAILQILILYALESKNKTVSVWRKTRTVCKATVMADFKRILISDPALRRKFKEDKTASTFTCRKTGTMIQFVGADDEEKVHGGQQDISYFNEISEMQERVYLQITQRTNDHILADYNPSKSFWFEKRAKAVDSIFIHSTYLKNSECPLPIIKQLNSYKPIDKDIIGEHNKNLLENVTDVREATDFIASIVETKEEFYDIFLGWKNTMEGTANQYMYDVYCLGKKAEKPEKIYNGWQHISLKDYLALPYTEYNGFDVGTAKPSALVGVKTDGKNFYFRKKIYKPAKEESGIIRLLDKAVELGLLDKKDMIITESAKMTYTNTLLENGYFAIPAIKGSGSLEGGIEVVQSFNIFYVQDRDVDAEYEEYSYHLDKYGEPTDTPIQTNDHILDALRYAITYMVYILGIKTGKRT